MAHKLTDSRLQPAINKKETDKGDREKRELYLLEKSKLSTDGPFALKPSYSLTITRRSLGEFY